MIQKTSSVPKPSSNKSWKSLAVHVSFAISIVYFLVALVWASKVIVQASSTLADQEKGGSIAISREQPTFPLRALPSTDTKFKAYDLAGGESWGLAYDELSGHIAVTSEKAGILVYDIDKVLHEELNAVVIPLKGAPSGLCSKKWRMQRLFLAIQANRNEIAVIDAETLTQIDTISVLGPSGFARIASSSDFDDPYVYCLALPNATDDTWGRSSPRPSP